MNWPAIPRSVPNLVRLVYVEQVDLDKIRKGDVELIDYLCAHRKTDFQTWKKDAWAMKRK